MGLGLCLPDDLFPLLVYGFQVLFITGSDIFQFFLLLTDILPFAFPVPFIAYDILQVFVHIDIIRSDVRGSVGYHVLGQTDLARKALEEFKNSVMATEEEDDKIARKMAKLKERNERKKQKQKVTAQPIFNKEVIGVGDNVRLKGQVSAGTVMELQGKQAVVAFGMIKSTVKLEQLEKVSKGQIKREIQKSTLVSSQTTDNMHEKKINFKQEIDVRGMRGDEALQSVTYFIDDAIQVGAGKVRILHGTGTGILRQLIRDYLRTVPGVRRFQDEHVQFGGAGVTVVEFD